MYIYIQDANASWTRDVAVLTQRGLFVCVCVCVCVRERERVVMCACVCAWLTQFSALLKVHFSRTANRESADRQTSAQEVWKWDASVEQDSAGETTMQKNKHWMEYHRGAPRTKRTVASVVYTNVEFEYAKSDGSSFLLIADAISVSMGWLRLVCFLKL